MQQQTVIRAGRIDKDDALQISIADITNAFPDYRVAFVVAEGLTHRAGAPGRARCADRRARGSGARAVGRHASCRKFPASRPGARPTRASASSRRAIAPRSSGWSRTCSPAVRSRASTRSSISTTRCRLPTCCRSAPTISTRSRRRSPSAMRARATASSTWRRRGRASRKRRRPGEVVYADAAHVLCRRWNWRQDARSLITPADHGGRW